MQVFFDEQIFVNQRFGGISRYICELARELAASDKIQVVVYGGWSRNEYLTSLAAQPGLRLSYLKRRDNLRINSQVKRLSRLYRRFSFARALREDPQTIYHPTFFEWDPGIGRRAKASVCTFYDFIPELDTNPNTRFLNQRKTVARAADALIAISESTRRDFERFIPDCRDKVSVTYLASDFSAQDTSDPGPSVLLVGNRSYYKNGENALRAYAKAALNIPGLILRVAGGGPLSTDEKAILAGIPEAQIEFIQANDASLQQAYSQSSLLLYPSRYEGFGLPVLEAMQCGCPVITSPISSLPEVGGEAAVYIDPDDIAGLAAAIERLINEPETAAAYREKGYRQAAGFNWVKTAAETLAIYENVLRGDR